MNIDAFRSSLENRFRIHQNNDRVGSNSTEKESMYKENISNIEYLLENIETYPIDYWEDLHLINCAHIAEHSNQYLEIITHYLENGNNLTLILNFLKNFFKAFIKDMPHITDKESFINALFLILNDSDFNNVSYALEILSIISNYQQDFGAFLIQNGITDVLFRTLQIIETSKSSLKLFAALGTQIPDMNAFNDLILNYKEAFPFEVLEAIEKYIPYEEQNIHTEQSIFQSIQFIFSYLESDDTSLVSKTLLLIEKILQTPETAIFLQQNTYFYPSLFTIIHSRKEFSSSILLCFIYSCYKSPSEISKLIELGILDLIKYFIDEGSFQDNIFSSILVTALLADAEILDDIEHILESNLIETIFCEYEQFEYFFSFILENIERGILNEIECDSNIIRQYLLSNECICSNLDDIISHDSNSSIIAQHILDQIDI